MKQTLNEAMHSEKSYWQELSAVRQEIWNLPVNKRRGLHSCIRKREFRKWQNQHWAGHQNFYSFFFLVFLGEQYHNGRWQLWKWLRWGWNCQEKERILIQSAHDVMFAQPSSNLPVSFVVNKAHGFIFCLFEGQNFASRRPLLLYTIYLHC